MLATVYHLDAYRKAAPAPEPPPSPLSMKAIAQEICARYHVGIGELRGDGRRRYIARPRQEFYALAYETGRFSYPQIGRWCGGRDHSTVIYGARAHWKRVRPIPMVGHNGGPPLEDWG